MIGYPRHARMVGRVLSELSPPLDEEIPWQRVVNAKGAISPRGDPEGCRRQCQKLLAEGAVMRSIGGEGLTTTFEGTVTAIVDLAECGWFPSPPPSEDFGSG